MGRLRIVAGALRGRRIPVPQVDAVRPTSDRVREALFSILGESVLGAAVLDAYCGSGALGFEALSRGASSVVFVDSDPRCIAVVRESAESLGLGKSTRFVVDRVRRWLERSDAGARFDLILADPPYGSDDLEGLIPAAGARILPGGRLVVERSSRRPPAPGTEGLGLVRTARYGESCVDIYRSEPSD